MPAKGAIVRCVDKANNTQSLTCAVLFDGGIVLVNGIMFMEFMKPKQQIWLESIVNETNSEIKVNSRIDEMMEFDLFEGNDEDSCDGRSIISQRAMICAGIWICPVLKSCVEKGRHAMHEICSKEKKNPAQLLQEKLISLFMFLRPYEAGNKHESVNIYNIIDSLTQPVRGQGIIVEWSPFCNFNFFNSVSRGIVGRVFGPNNCLILFDGVVSPKISGAPIFLANDSRLGKNEKGALIGTVLGSFNGSTLLVGISLLPVLWRLLPPERRNEFNARSLLHSNFQELLDETVVSIYCGNFTSSGVVVDSASGIILTASHSIIDVTIDVLHKGNIYQADLIYKTPVDVMYDLAVIKINRKNCFVAQMKMAQTQARIGEEVYSVSFPYNMGIELADVKPFVSLGCVAKVNPDYIQTTCYVSHGSSGGAIVRNGQLLGIISFIMTSESVNYNHINFAVLATAFRKNVLDYIETGDVECLRELEFRKTSRAMPFSNSKI